MNHPMRWMFPDDPGPDGLTVSQSYFDRTPYAEVDDADRVVYVEHHRTLGDRVADVVGAGLVLERLVEPEWPDDLDEVWGQWSPLRGRALPRHRDLLLPPARERGRVIGRSRATPSGRAPEVVLDDLLRDQQPRFADLDPALPPAVLPPPGDVIVRRRRRRRRGGRRSSPTTRWPAGSAPLLWSAAEVTELHPVPGLRGAAPALDGLLAEWRARHPRPRAARLGLGGRGHLAQP